MSKPISNSVQSTIRAGSCPHGLPPAACPICSGGMSGNGKIKDSTMSKPIKMNQWSWLKCYAVGMAMKSQETRIQNKKDAFEKQIEFAKNLKQSILNLSEKIKNALNNIQKNNSPFIANIIVNISRIIIFPVLSFIAKIPQLIEKAVQIQKNINIFINSISEKIVAILGDIKNFINKKLLEKMKIKAKKFFLFFMSDIEDENYKNDDTLAVFKSRELIKYTVKILNNLLKRNKNANRSN